MRNVAIWKIRTFLGVCSFGNRKFLVPSRIRTLCELSADCERLIERAMTQQGLSARAHDRILKVARTIADLEDVASLEPKHIAEAIQYRSLDRTYWT